LPHCSAIGLLGETQYALYYVEIKRPQHTQSLVAKSFDYESD
jgi:hypothetical protein